MRCAFYWGDYWLRVLNSQRNNTRWPWPFEMRCTITGYHVLSQMIYHWIRLRIPKMLEDALKFLFYCRTRLLFPTVFVSGESNTKTLGIHIFFFILNIFFIMSSSARISFTIAWSVKKKIKKNIVLYHSWFYIRTASALSRAPPPFYKAAFHGGDKYMLKQVQWFAKAELPIPPKAGQIRSCGSNSLLNWKVHWLVICTLCQRSLSRLDGGCSEIIKYEIRQTFCFNGILWWAFEWTFGFHNESVARGSRWFTPAKQPW